MRRMLLLVNTIIVVIVANAGAADSDQQYASEEKNTSHRFRDQIGAINWHGLPTNVRDKIVAQEISGNPDVRSAIELAIGDHRKIFGDSIGNILGNIAARKIIYNFACQRVQPFLECVVWGEVERDFEKRNLAVVRKGNYLMLYKLQCSDAVLFWGPVAGTDEDHVAAGMTPGARYDKDAKVNDLSRNEKVHARPT